MSARTTFASARSRVFSAALLTASLAFVAGCSNEQLSEAPPNLTPPAPAADDVAGFGTNKDALGEVANGYPADEERMVHVLTNLSRHAPKNNCDDFTTSKYPTEPWGDAGVPANIKKNPLVYSLIGNKAGRFMSKHMGDIGCFQHPSCCVLGNVGGTVQCTAPAMCDASNVPCNDACGKEFTGGTPIADRYALLGMTTWSGENIARGYVSAESVWCGWMKSKGHRENIYSDHSELGVGLYETPMTCGRYWTQSFGSGGPPIPRIPVASAMYFPPNPKTALQLYFAANYFHNGASGPPKRSVVVVEGHCFDMEKKWGYDDNGTWETHFTAPDDIPAGCHPYYFLFVDADADRWTYPDNGQLYVAIGNNASCPASYDTKPQLPADCETGVQACTEGATQSCYTGPANTDGKGECHAGYQVCKNGFWSSCKSEKVPIPEVCDGLDNDCDGRVDQGNPDGNASCTVDGERGVCKTGIKQCLGGTIVCVSTQAPQVETCDGIDNDCDGVVDDGFGIQTCGTGECFRTVQTCFNGQLQVCTPGTPQPEILDTRDNDCDGLIDNGFDCRKPDGGVPGARLCYTFPVTDQDGGSKPINAPCVRGTQTCDPATGAWSLCNGEVGPQPEICDGKDNDCNGKVDDTTELGWERCGTGGCTAYTVSCKAGQPVTCMPSAPASEACNSIDDDCDGTIDEGCVCHDGNQLDCYSGAPETLLLDGGICHVGKRSCTGGQWTGCEGEVAPTTEYCDGIDNDCNGKVDDNCVQPPQPDGGMDAGTPSSDAGSEEVDAGDGGGGGGTGCGCNAGPGSAAAIFPALMFAFVALRRRRGV